MNPLLSPSVGVALLLPTAAPAQLHPVSSAPPSAPACNAAGVDTVVANKMHHWIVHVMQVAVVRRGRIIYDKASGVVDLETRAAETPVTAFTDIEVVSSAGMLDPTPASC